MLSKFLNPKNDVAFKKIFGTPKNQDILIHFLNDMLVFKCGKPITAVTFLKTIQDPDIAAKKTSIVDIMCTDNIGNSYIVEMQVAEGDDFIKRAQYYAAKAYSSQLQVGDEYSTLKEIIFLAITNFIMFPNKPAFKSDHVILDKDTNEHDLKDFSFTFLELAKFNKTKNQLETIIDRWAFFFKHAEETTEQDLPVIIGNNPIIQRAYEELNKFSWSKEQLNEYETVIKRDLDYNAILSKQYNAGKIEGKTEGKIEGKAENIRKTVVAMLSKKLDINLIGEITGLTINEVLEIARNHK